MPRLTDGEIAPGIAAKQMKSKEVVLNILASFEDGLANPHAIDPSTLHAFGSFREMCCWDDAENGISPISENTLRKYITELYIGGIKAFERDRRKLLSAAKKKKVVSGTKASYMEISSKLAEENQILTNQIMQFSAQYLDLLEKTSDMAKAHRSLQNFLNAHKSIYPQASKGLSVIAGAKENEKTSKIMEKN